MDLSEARSHYTRLHGEWAEAQVAWDEARRACMIKAVNGPAVTAEDLRHVDKLEARANELRDALDEFVGRYLGD